MYLLPFFFIYRVHFFRTFNVIDANEIEDSITNGITMVKKEKGIIEAVKA